MDYIVHLKDLKPFDVKSVNLIEIRDDSYFIYGEDGSLLLTAPRENVKCIASRNIIEK